LVGDGTPDAAAAPVEPDEYTGGPITDWPDELDEDDAATTQTPADVRSESPFGEDREPPSSSDASAAEPQANGHPDIGRQQTEHLPSSPSEGPALSAIEEVPPAAPEANGSGALPATTETDTEREPEPVEAQPAGPPRRGWWKRLIE
jgi:hypothetical protein